MNNTILIIDDELIQASNLKKAISSERSDLEIIIASTEEGIKKSISEDYFNIAIVDLRMDAFDINGFDIIKDIIALNPIAKIIVVSAFTTEYEDDLNEVIKSGKISAIVSKEKYEVFKKAVISHIDKIIEEFNSDLSLINSSLNFLYSEVKNETDNQKKGLRFEYFVSTLFSQMGFNHIGKRVIDKSRNEVDLAVRNDITDPFFQKFKPYFLVECKNTMEEVDKNQFIQFRSKLENTNSLSNLGFIITAKGFKRTSYLEAIRGSKDDYKIIFISNVEIVKIINSDNLLDALKRIIDSQVKDN